MAIYHCSVKIIGRSSGKTSVGAAAYRAGEKLTNDYDGITHDYTRKNWVVFRNILLPENAPESFRDRGTLWNAVEAAEKTKDAQLAREFEIALPIELDRDRQIRLIESFVREELVSKGMVADICIHDPPLTNDLHQPVDASGNVTKDREKMQFINPHAHVLCTVRPIGAVGKLEAKSQIEYICKCENEEKAFTASEYEKAKTDGWRKEYKYKDGHGKKIWLTADEAGARSLERISKNPRTTPYGRKNEKVQQWNSKEQILEWRKAWEDYANKSLKEAGMEERIDSRSYKARGEELIASVHMGIAATNMEKRMKRLLKNGNRPGHIQRSDLAEINSVIREFNETCRRMKYAIRDAAASVSDTVKRVIDKLLDIRHRLIGMHSYAEYFSSKSSAIKKEAENDENLEKAYTEAERILSEKQLMIKNRLREITDKFNATGLAEFLKRAGYKKELGSLKAQLDQISDYRSKIADRYGISCDDDLQALKVRICNARKTMEKLDQGKEEVCLEIDALRSDFNSGFSSLDEDGKAIARELLTSERDLRNTNTDDIYDINGVIRTEDEAVLKNKARYQADSYIRSVIDDKGDHHINEKTLVR